MRLVTLVTAIALLGGILAAQQFDPKSPVDFRISTDKTAYAPKSVISVKFTLTNTSPLSFHVFRFLKECSNQDGFVSFQILDQKDHNLRTWKCSADSWPPLAHVDVLEELSNQNLWITLKHGESYHGKLEIELPASKGNYRLKAELIPPAFTDEQRNILLLNHISSLDKACAAPIISITVD